MTDSRRKWPLVLVLAIVASAILFTTLGCGGKPTAKKNPQLQMLTASDVADRYKFFFSVQNDRKDIEQGTFTLFPWAGDEFILATPALPKVLHKDETTKKWSSSNHTLTVQTSRSYWIARGEVIGSHPRTRMVKVRFGTKELAVPVKIALITEASPFNITRETADRLKNLPSSNLHRWRVKVALPNHETDYYVPNALRCEGYGNYVSAEVLFDLSAFLFCAQNEYSRRLASDKFVKLVGANKEYQKLRAKEHRTSWERGRMWDLYVTLQYRASRRALAKSAALRPAAILKEFVFTVPVHIEAIDDVTIELANSVNGVTVK